MSARRSAVLAGVAVVGVGLGACARAVVREAAVVGDGARNDARDPLVALLGELEGEVLEAYERDAPPEVAGVLSGAIGGARIGAGPGDFLVGEELQRAPSQWPLVVDPNDAIGVTSKRLEAHLSSDLTAAWISDEVSWRYPVCGKLAIIPLRVTALYARDGDRWAPVIEHVSYARMQSGAEGEVRGRSIAAAVASRDVSDALSRSIAPLLRARATDADPAPVRMPSVSLGPEASVIGPGITDEWHGPDLVRARLGPGRLRAEERRVGLVGRGAKGATIAYWVGNFVAEGDGGTAVRLRASFVFELRSSGWTVVQAHVSAPIDDEVLAQDIFGSSLEGLNPLRVQCAVREVLGP